jgi:hypothetical protein
VDDPPSTYINEKLRDEHENWQVPLEIRNSADPGLFAECQYVRFPIKIGNDGRIYALNLFPAPLENRGGGIAEYSGRPRDNFSISDNPAQQVFKCSITNYGTKPMLSVAIGLYLVFREAVRDKNQPNSVRSGDILAQRPWLIVIPKIDPGVGSPFIFYIWNVTDKWGTVAFPDSAVAEYIGDPERFKFRLSSSNSFPITLTPKPEEPAANATSTPK